MRLLDDPVFFAPFVPFFDPRMGRPSTPMETYLRLMFLKFRYRLGFESLCREVSDSITGGSSAGSGSTSRTRPP
jgi:IS5 family transposase